LKGVVRKLAEEGWRIRNKYIKARSFGRGYMIVRSTLGRTRRESDKNRTDEVGRGRTGNKLGPHYGGLLEREAPSSSYK